MTKRGITALVALGFAGLMGLFTLLGCWYTVDQGERGVLLRFGKVAGIAQPGLGFKLPWVDSVVKLSVQTHIITYDKMHTYTKDQQPAELRVSVNYTVQASKVEEVYSTYGSTENMVARLISPHVYQHAKIVLGAYTAVSAIQGRGQLNQDIATSIQKSVEGPVLIESVQVENIDYSKAYEQSIEQRMLAEVEVQRVRQTAEREKVQAQIVETQANARAAAVLAEAKASAEAITLKGEAEAKAISARAAALGSNPGLVALTQAERWDGKLPQTMIPNGAVPMLSGVGR